MKNSTLFPLSVTRKLKMGALSIVTLFIFGSANLFAQSCPSPTDLSSPFLSTSSVNLSWTDVGASDGYLVQYRVEAGSPTWTNAPGNPYFVTNVSLTGLASENYLWRVRSDCSSSVGGTSPYSTSNFSTFPGGSCISALPIACGGTATGTTVGAFVNGIPSNCGTSGGGGGKVWYKVTGNGGAMFASLCANTSFDTKLWVYSGTCGSLVCVGGNDDDCGLQSNVIWTATLGTEYFIIVGGFANNEGAYQLDLNCNASPLDPTNDEICNAVTVKPGNSTSLNTYPLFSDISCNNKLVDTEEASGSNEASCQGPEGNSVWYKFKTPMCAVGGVVPFQIEVSTDNQFTNFDTKIELFSSSNGLCTGTLTSIECNNDAQSEITSCGGFSTLTSTIVRSDLLPNTNYYVLITGGNNAFGIVEVSGRALTDPHTATATSPTQITMTTADKGATLNTYYIRRVGYGGYAIFNSTALSYSRLVANGFVYQTQMLYRCTMAPKQFYRTPVVSVDVTADPACGVISTLNCAPSGPGNYTLTWAEVPGVYTNGGVLSGYSIGYRPIGSDTTAYVFVSNPAVSCTGGTCSFVFTGLTDLAGYEFWVYSRCSATFAPRSNISTCALAKSATTDVHTFVNPVSGTEFVDVRLSDDWNNFDLVFPDLGDYYVGINKENEIYALKIAEPNMIHSGADVSFELVPNPTNASTTMTFNSTIKSGTYQVVDPMGRNILSGDISNTNTIELDGSKWNAGVYLVNVITNDKTTMRRLVISK